jgi:hypothetical protein
VVLAFLLLIDHDDAAGPSEAGMAGNNWIIPACCRKQPRKTIFSNISEVEDTLRSDEIRCELFTADCDHSLRP